MHLGLAVRPSHDILCGWLKAASIVGGQCMLSCQYKLWRYIGLRDHQLHVNLLWLRAYNMLFRLTTLKL